MKLRAKLFAAMLFLSPILLACASTVLTPVPASTTNTPEPAATFPTATAVPSAVQVPTLIYPSPTPSQTDPPSPEPVLFVDPRDGGLKVGLGEWAVTLEADSIRPAEVTFVIHNGGTRHHGFRIRSGFDDRFEARTELISPGNDAELTVKLPSGTYEVDCYVEEPGVGEHDELGMESILTVRADAPLIPVQQETPDPAVAIKQFAFAPPMLEVAVGTTVVWTNNDPVQHTVSAEDSTFDSGLIEPDARFTHAFNSPGTYLYLCRVHPTMRAQVNVAIRASSN